MKRYFLKHRSIYHKRERKKLRELLKLFVKEKIRNSKIVESQSDSSINEKNIKHNKIVKEEKFYIQKYIDNINNILENTKENMGKIPKQNDEHLLHNGTLRLSGTSKVTTIEGPKIQFDLPPILIKKPNQSKPKHPVKSATACNNMSSVYFTNTDNTVYNITFVTNNVKVNPLYLEKRDVPVRKNDKESQSLNNYVYKETYSKTGVRFCILKRFFFLPKKNKKNLFSALGQTAPVKVYCTHLYDDSDKKNVNRKKKSKNISNTTKNTKDGGFINLLFEKTEYRIQCQPFQMDSIRPLLRSGTEISKCNHGSINARYKNDILQFKFELELVNIQTVNSRVTRASQSYDKYAYIQYFSYINDRRVILTLPMSHYLYKEPMFKIFQRNLKLALNKCEPIWLRDARRQKKSEIAKENFEFIAKQVLDSTNSTVFLAVQNDEVFKFRGNALSRLKVVSTKIYEKFVIERQRETFEQEILKHRHMGVIPIVIPDWNLYEYDN